MNQSNITIFHDPPNFVAIINAMVGANIIPDNNNGFQNFSYAARQSSAIC